MLRKRAYPWFLIVALSFLVALAILSRPAQASDAKYLSNDHRSNLGSWQWKYKAWMPKHWQNLAQCEAGMNWKHNSGTFQGGFGFHHGSWDDYAPARYPSEAYLATPWQQYQVARRIAAKYGIAEPWGCWRGADHAWVRNGLPEYGTRR